MIKAQVIKKLGIETGTNNAGKEWRKAGFVVETLGDYPKKIKMDVWGQAVDGIYAELSEGFTATFHVNLESREYNDRWYTDIKCFKVEA